MILIEYNKAAESRKNKFSSLSLDSLITEHKQLINEVKKGNKAIDYNSITSTGLIYKMREMQLLDPVEEFSEPNENKDYNDESKFSEHRIS